MKAVAEAAGATPSQVALAWVLSHGDRIITIPGPTRMADLTGNLGAADISLTADQAVRAERLAERVKGARYPEQGMRNINV